MNFSGNMWLMILLKVTKNTGLDPLSRRYIVGKNILGNSN